MRGRKSQSQVLDVRIFNMTEYFWSMLMRGNYAALLHTAGSQNARGYVTSHILGDCQSLVSRLPVVKEKILQHDPLRRRKGLSFLEIVGQMAHLGAL